MPRNPYQYLGTSGYGGNMMGGNYGYGQQGQNNPYGQAQQGSANYQQSYPGGGGGGNFYYPGGGQSQTGYLGPGAAERMPSPGGRFPGSPNQQLSPTQGGKGGGGGWGGPNTGMGGIAQQQQQRLQQQQYGPRSSQGNRNMMMDQYRQLFEQRQLEQQLGLGPSAPGWNPYSHLSVHGYPTMPGQSL